MLLLFGEPNFLRLARILRLIYIYCIFKKPVFKMKTRKKEKAKSHFKFILKRRRTMQKYYLAALLENSQVVLLFMLF